MLDNYDGRIIDLTLFFKKGEFLIACPCCHKLTELVWEDYVEVPMIHHWGCTPFSLTTPHLFLTFDPPTDNIKLLRKLQERCDVRQTIPMVFTIKGRFLFVERVISDKLTMLTSQHQLSDQEIRNFIHEYPKEYCEESKEYLNSRGIIWHDYEEKIDYGSNFNLSLPCGSYSTEHPMIPYPENYTLNHDGTEVMALLRDYPVPGQKRWVYYTGD